MYANYEKCQKLRLPATPVWQHPDFRFFALQQARLVSPRASGTLVHAQNLSDNDSRIYLSTRRVQTVSYHQRENVEQIVEFAFSLHRAKVELAKRGVGVDCRFKGGHVVQR